MIFLLDTHAFIWAVTDVAKLSDSVKENIEDGENTIYVSAISYWEISIKYSIGKLNLWGLLPQDFPGFAGMMGFKSIALTPYESSKSHFLEAMYHKDPFDRMLIWQALQQNLTLITKDEQIMKYQSEGLKTLW